MFKKPLRLGLVLGAAILILIAVWRFDQAGQKYVDQPLSAVVEELGVPDFIGQNVTISHGRVKVLLIDATAQDPKSVKDWSSPTNIVVAVWCLSEPAKRNARYFYDEMKNDPNFDGAAWYSSRSRFGERFHLADVKQNLRVQSLRTVRVDAVSLRAIGLPPKVSRSVTAEQR